jgi:hypothetical protein
MAQMTMSLLDGKKMWGGDKTYHVFLSFSVLWQNKNNPSIDKHLSSSKLSPLASGSCDFSDKLSVSYIQNTYYMKFTQKKAIFWFSACARVSTKRRHFFKGSTFFPKRFNVKNIVYVLSPPNVFDFGYMFYLDGEFDIVAQVDVIAFANFGEVEEYFADYVRPKTNKKIWLEFLAGKKLSEHLLLPYCERGFPSLLLRNNPNTYCICYFMS